jgi:hypothetical protein
MEGLLASLEAFLDEGKKHSILFIGAVKKAQMWRYSPSVVPMNRIGSHDSALSRSLV